MSTDYNIVCYTCKEIGPSFAASSISWGYKVWNTDEWMKWLGHREVCGHHEGHDLRIVHEQADLPWNDEGGGEVKKLTADHTGLGVISNHEFLMDGNKITAKFTTGAVWAVPFNLDLYDGLDLVFSFSSQQLAVELFAMHRPYTFEFFLGAVEK